jgi:Cu(I)/Ag(I) efflux system membrane fusion protein
VKVGHQAGGYSEVLEGLSDGESVVTRANFLIDAESNLKSALDSLGSAEKLLEPETTTPDTQVMPEQDHSQHSMEH